MAMVTNVTSLTGNGLKDWWIQRATAAFFLGYSVFLFAYLLTHCHLEYAQWQGLFHHTGFKIATVLALFSLTIHTWIGVWTVMTDYLKCTALRFSLQLAVMTLLSGQMIYGLMIVWGQ
jgi:succinate dehydrogenase / fumarate reductase membrane anchor subunit